MNFIATFFGLIAAALFGLLIHFQRKGLDTNDPLFGAFISVFAMTALLWILSPLFIDYNWILTKPTLIFFIGGLFFPAFAQVAQTFSITKVGPAITSSLGAFAPFFATVPAVFFLKEPWSLQLVMGMLIMTTGLILVTTKTDKLKRNWPIWVLLFPLGASLARGIIQPIVKVGMLEIPSPFFATLILGSSSTIVLFIIIISTGKYKNLISFTDGIKWFSISGIVNALGILSIFYAVYLGGVTLAAPLVATSPVWALLFGYFIFKNEILSLRHIFVAALVVIGSILIVLR